MSASARLLRLRRVTNVALLAIFVAMSERPSQAFQETDEEARSTLAWVQRFLMLVFSETRPHFAQLIIVPEQPWDGVVRHIRYAALKSGQEPLQPNLSAREIMARSILNGSFDFDAKGRLERASLHGSLVNQPALVDLAAELNRRALPHRELEAFLRTSKVRFGPWAQTDLLAAVGLQRLQPLLGSFSIERTEFLPRAGEEGDYFPRWEIRIIQDGRTYDIYVEPFGGRIIGIHFRPPHDGAAAPHSDGRR